MIRSSLLRGRQSWHCHTFVNSLIGRGPSRSIPVIQQKFGLLIEASKNPSNRTTTILLRSSSTTTANSSPTKKGDRGGFIRSWMKQKDRLIKSDLGTLKDKDWKDASAAINIMRTHPDFDSSERRHRDMFALLDRLSKEIENENRKSPKKKNRKKGSKLPTGLLKEVMVAWKEHAFSLMPKEVREDTIERQIQAKKSLGIFSQMGPIAPEFVIKKLDRYFKMGMFKADIKIYDIVFRVMSFDPELGAPLADELFERLKKASSFDPSNGIHPTGKSVNEVIEIWAHSRLPKGPKQAEAYLAELKGWFARSNRKELKVGTGIYCAVMEAHSRSNENSDLYIRRNELIFGYFLYSCFWLPKI